MINTVTIYTDGACSGNPGVGGWGAILICGNNSKKISGGELNTTNNRMELSAVINALSCLKQQSNVKLYSDSAYVVNAFTQGWLEKWSKLGWYTSKKQPVQNKDLWIKLFALTEKHSVKFIKVKGHSDNALNNECDAIARAAITNLTR